MRFTAQIFGVGAMISLFIGYQQSERKKLVAAKLSADAFWVVHYLLLGGIAGMIPNFIGIFREIVFINRENKKWADKVIWPAAFIIISWVMGIFTFRSAFNILPIAASTFVTVSLWLKNPIITKIITVPVCLAFLVYDVYVGSVIGIINESVSVISIIISFLKNIHNKKTA